MNNFIVKGERKGRSPDHRAVGGRDGDARRNGPEDRESCRDRVSQSGVHQQDPDVRDKVKAKKEQGETTKVRDSLFYKKTLAE